MKRKPTFEYGKPFHDKGYGVTITNGTPEQVKAVRASVVCNYTPSEDYKINQQARGFVQGYDEQGGWVFIEYWSEPEEHAASVQHLRNVFNNVVVFSPNLKKYRPRVQYFIFGEGQNRRARTLRKVRAILRESYLKGERRYVDRDTRTSSMDETSRLFRHSSGYELDLIRPFGRNLWPRKAHRYYAKRNKA